MIIDTAWQALGLAVIYCGGFIAVAVILYTLIVTKGWRK